jgi:hypothetical protein
VRVPVISHAVTAFDLAVLLRPARPDVPVPHASSLHGEHELERKLTTVIALQLPDPERERSHELR